MRGCRANLNCSHSNHCFNHSFGYRNALNYGKRRRDITRAQEGLLCTNEIRIDRESTKASYPVIAPYAKYSDHAYTNCRKGRPKRKRNHSQGENAACRQRSRSQVAAVTTIDKWISHRPESLPVATSPPLATRPWRSLQRLASRLPLPAAPGRGASSRAPPRGGSRWGRP